MIGVTTLCGNAIVSEVMEFHGLATSEQSELSSVIVEPVASGAEGVLEEETRGAANVVRTRKG